MPAKRRAQGEERAVYVISVAAELAGVHPQTLRMYERKGLISPKRAEGRGRRYSDRDVEHVRIIQSLTQDRGVNLAGVEMVMELTRQLEQTRESLRRIESQLAEQQRQMREEFERVKRSMSLVPVRSAIVPWKTANKSPFKERS